MTAPSATVDQAPGRLPTGVNAGARFGPSAAAVAKRTVRKFLRTPQLIVFAAANGLIFLVLFRYVFGGAISIEGQRYVDFLIPGFLVTMVIFSGVGASAGVAEDVEKGFFDRLRSLPIPRGSVMAGRALADTALVVWSLAFSAALGFAFGFRASGSVMELLAAFGLCVWFGFAFAWVFITIGLVAGTAQSAQGMSMVVWPLVFLSSAYVPVASLPGWLQAFAEHQPISVMVNAVRSLTGGPAAQAVMNHATAYYVEVSLVWTAAIVVGFGLLAANRFARR